MNKTKRILRPSLVIAILLLAPISAHVPTNSGHIQVTKEKGEINNQILTRILTLADFKLNMINAQTINDYSQMERDTSPTISDISSPTILRVGEEGAWTINAFESEHTNLTYSVDWGDTPIIAKLFGAQQVQTSEENSFVHSYKKPGTYKIRFSIHNEHNEITTITVTVQIIERM